MIEMRRAQLGFGDGLIADEVSDLREDWMRHADQVLADEQIVAAVYEALAKRTFGDRRFPDPQPKKFSEGIMDLSRIDPASVIVRENVPTLRKDPPG